MSAVLPPLQKRSLRQRISDWIFRARAPETPPVQLVQRRIFILPTRTGYFFVVVLVLLLIASINYSLSLGFMLTFLLAGMGGVGMLHTFANLVRLSISPWVARLSEKYPVPAPISRVSPSVLGNSPSAFFSFRATWCCPISPKSIPHLAS